MFEARCRSIGRTAIAAPNRGSHRPHPSTRLVSLESHLPTSNLGALDRLRRELHWLRSRLRPLSSSVPFHGRSARTSTRRESTPPCMPLRSDARWSISTRGSRQRSSRLVPNRSTSHIDRCLASVGPTTALPSMAASWNRSGLSCGATSTSFGIKDVR
jgi:hypothetical protein